MNEEQEPSLQPRPEPSEESETTQAPAEPTPPQASAGEQASPQPGGAVDKSQAKPTRRDLLAQATVGLGACAALGACGVVAAAVVGTPLAQEAQAARWCPLGLAKDLAQGARKLPVRAPGRDAWRRFGARALGRVVVVKDGEAVSVFSAACPHNGCDVAVGEGGADLVCPCHKSRFSLDGTRLGGQSPRDLDLLETRVRKGQLEVKFQRFAFGTPDRKPI
ncbi:MAG: Rieske 2Fe-2S domain-containing protein [Planctomycetes bacterium]|nr:Rieske 2Fe-2S domain-containing protein [Planctomycetota bacterium]